MSAGGESVIVTWQKYWFIGFLAAVFSSCAHFDQTVQEPASPSELERLRQADVTARGPQNVAPGPQNLAGGPNQSNRYEVYPGAEPRPVKIPKRTGATPVGDGYELNFSNAPLEELAKVILGDTLGLAYSFDPRVQGRVSLSTGRAVSRDELLRVFESVLQMHNGALVNGSGQYRVILLSEARKGGAGAVSYARENKRAGPGYGVSIYPLQHVSSSVMLRMLNAFVARSGTLRADANNNILLIRGTSRERTALMDVIASFDVDWLKGQTAAIFPVSHATPDEMIQELSRIFRTEDGEIGNNVVRFQPIDRLNAVLALTRNRKLMGKVESWVRRLDRTNAAGVNLYVYRVENGKAQDLTAVLNDTFTGQVTVSRTNRSQVAPNRAVRRTRADAEDEDEDGSAARNAASANQPRAASRRSRSGRLSLSSDVRITADEINNKLLIRATGRDYQKILRILRRIDKPPLQVHINATIAEVTLNNNLRYGVQVFLRNSSPTGALGVSNGNSLVIQPNFPGLNFLVGSTSNPKVLLDALSGVTDVKVVSSPSLVVLNNQSATLQVGDEVPITTRQATSVTDPLAPVVNTIEFRDTGVILKVKPRVNSSGLVTMEIEQEISNVSGTAATATGTLTPTISQRKISSVIAVYSGQMVVLGGLISEREEKNKNRVPIFEHVPIIGDLVGSTNNSKVRTELVVFLRPKVIRDGHDASLVAQELRSRLRSMSPAPKYNRPYYKNGRPVYKRGNAPRRSKNWN